MKHHFILLRLACLALFAGGVALDVLWLLPANRTYARDYLDRSIALSVGTYATCRVINGGVSSIQESSISISPWGIGIQYEAGQVLDPINDATERLSEACVKSMALLGVQRLLLSAVNTYTVIPFYAFLGLFLMGVSLTRVRGPTVFAGRLALLLLLLRLSTPVLCWIGTEMNEQYFSPRIDEEQAKLSEVKAIALAEFEAEMPELTSESRPVEGRMDAIAQFFTEFRDRIVSLSYAVRHRASSLSEAVVYMKDHFGEITLSLARLFSLVIEQVLVQVFLLPLGILYLLKKIYEGISGEHLQQLVDRLHALKPQPGTPDVASGT
jgi:hypothetical protein